MLKKLLTFSLCLLTATTSFAGDITLDADEQVEYHQKEQKLVAKGNAKATKENFSINADTLIGYYNPKIKNKISRIEAIKNVKMTTPDAIITGDNMTYDVNEDSATLIGAPAQIKNTDFTITSKGPITYYQSQQKAIAKDNIEAIDKQGNRVYADLMTAWFTKDENNKLILDKIDIEQNVKIINKDATVTALKGTYHARLGKIFLYENVVIKQQENILKGALAETDLNTSISKLISNEKSGRVHGVFKEKKKE